tara:strand:- start:135 stop:446 length:312 start_codon:yes stop_codon:yes gene_type:complete
VAVYRNITGELTQELLVAGGNISNPNIRLNNIDTKNHQCKVDLYIEKKLTGKFYLIKDFILHVGEPMTSKFIFNNSAGEFSLYIKLTKIFSGDTPAVDVIITK